MSESTLLDAVQLLKRVPRSGWIYAGVNLADVETVAEHTFSVAFLSMLLTDALRQRGTQVDTSKIMKMALIHDLSESLTFDISKRYLDFLGKKGRSIKHELEETANRKLFSTLPPQLRQQALAMAREHTVGKTMEAKIVAAADRFDLLMQLKTYRRSGYESEIFGEMVRKASAEIRAMKNPIFNLMLRSINQSSSE